MTNGWIDIKNTDMMLIMGGNPAENHPCGFKWPIEAKRQRNAKMIVVDPRFTRTAAVADLFVQIRAGADIAFLGGLIRYAIENNRIARDYLIHYTNAAFLVQDGLQAARGRPVLRLRCGDPYLRPGHLELRKHVGQVTGPAQRPDTRKHPRSVFQLLKKHYSRYTPEMVERITGIPKDQFLKAADLFTSIRKDGDMKKVAHHPLRGGLDAAQLRHADHPHGRHAATAAGQRGTRRRRRERAARPLQHSGRHRHGRHLRHPARLSEDAQSRRHRFQGVPGAHHAQAGQAGALGVVQLLVEHHQVRGLLPQGDVRRCREERERLGVPLPAEDRSQLSPGPKSGTTCTAATSRDCWPSA